MSPSYPPSWLAVKPKKLNALLQQKQLKQGLKGSQMIKSLIASFNSTQCFTREKKREELLFLKQYFSLALFVTVQCYMLKGQIMYFGFNIQCLTTVSSKTASSFTSNMLILLKLAALKMSVFASQSHFILYVKDESHHRPVQNERTICFPNLSPLVRYSARPCTLFSVFQT